MRMDISNGLVSIELDIDEVTDELDDETIATIASDRGIVGDLSAIDEDDLISELENRDLEGRIIENMDLTDIVDQLGTENVLEQFSPQDVVDYYGDNLLEYFAPDVVIEFAKEIDNSPTAPPEVLAAFDVLSHFFHPDVQMGRRGF